MALLALVGAAACSGHADCPQPITHALADEHLGEPCGLDAHCSAGLSCRSIYPVSTGTSSFGANACTVACESAAVSCPGGSTCATVGRIKSCLPSCTSDADCRTAVSAGSCIGGAADAGHCERTSCTVDAQCDAGFVCEIPGVVCCPAGAQCLFAGPIPGYCRNPAATTDGG